MTTSHPASSCRVISITSGALPKAHALLALIRNQRVINLGEIADAIRADSMLSYLVTEAACRESGWPWLSVEEAVVLLGIEGICSLLSLPHCHGRSASQICGALHSNSTFSAANLHPFATSQGGQE